MSAHVIVDITGGRYTPDRRIMRPSLVQLLAFWGLFYYELKANALGHGAAIGTDEFVSAWVDNRSKGKVTLFPCPVDITIDGPWPAAGCRRNGRMLKRDRPIALGAFPGNSGTKNCVDQALQLDIPVYAWIDASNKFELIN